MLTRIEIDGFKTFRDFDLSIAPFMALLGRNASGKSNLFDAIQFLRHISSGSLIEAVSEMRGDLNELFHHDVEGNRTTKMRFGVEVLLEADVRDDFGDVVPVRHSRLRYEIDLALRPVPIRNNGRAAPENVRRERLYVEREDVRLIRQPNDGWLRRYFPSPKARRNIARYSARSVDVLLETTTDASGRPVFAIHQEGRAGKPKLLPAAEAVATVLSSLTTATEYPLLYALKRELESWTLLHLDPAALREVNSYDDDDHLTPRGGNLANTLRRLQEITATEDRPEGAVSDIAADLARIIPGVSGLAIDEDTARRQRQVVVHTRGDAPYSARVASDGTLRALALMTALYDPDRSGLICFEEPENGIYPQRLVDFVRHLRRLVRLSIERRTQNSHAPLLQLLLSSHSPVMLAALEHDEMGEVNGVRSDVAFVDLATRTNESRTSRISRARAIKGQAQGTLPADILAQVVSPAEIDSFQVWELLGA